MGRFSLRPMLRRLSSRQATTTTITTTTTTTTSAAAPRSDCCSDTTAVTEASPATSPNLLPAFRESSSLARLRDKFRAHGASSSISAAALPPDARAADCVSVVTSDGLPDARTLSTVSLRITSATVESAACTIEGQHYPPHSTGDLAPPPSQPAPALGKLGATKPDPRPGSQSPTPTLPPPTPPPPTPPPPPPPTPPLPNLDIDDHLLENPRVVLEEPTPEALSGGPHAKDFFGSSQRPATADSSQEQYDAGVGQKLTPTHSYASLNTLAQPADVEARRQSLVGSVNAKVVKTLVGQPLTRSSGPSAPSTVVRPDSSPIITDTSAMLQRKIWVKRPNASATLVQIREDDLVDDVRDMILRKYANSLGKTFDAPDLTLSIITRSENAGPRSSRLLGPEEEICRTIDSYYPGGQTVEEALIIDLPQRRTPRPSPRISHHSYHAADEIRPPETGTDYFPPMPATINPALPNHISREHHGSVTAADHPRSIAVLNTGVLPPLPSPGSTTRRHRAEREHRPKYGRQHTSSPPIMSHGNAGSAMVPAPAIPPSHLSRSTRPRVDSSASEHHGNGVPVAPPLPSPPAPEIQQIGRPGSGPPTPSSVISGARAHALRPRKPRKAGAEQVGSKSRGSTPHLDPYNLNAGLGNIAAVLDGSVPPINVLIVEDNIINLRILEGLMKRLKVRWQTAMNGQIAVDKWRMGGYHLVLMDIQMPLMNGLQATKEIRRLERVNGIGVFSQTPGTANENGPSTVAKGEQEETKPHNPDDDKLRKSEGLFKSPIIIVALTASSLQSDRHEALAAGCNDFLTKPVNFVWLERKVKEWGCMQALIDFDGWRKWKDYAAKEEADKSEEQKLKDREQGEKQKVKMEKMAKLQEKQKQRAEEQAKEKERKKRESMGEPLSPPVGPEEPPVVTAS